MTRESFSGTEEKLLKRISVLKDLVSLQDVYEKPCPLLINQLNDLTVLCKFLESAADKLKKSIEASIKN